MTPATLQSLRRLLFFSVEEAAAWVGGVSPRSWQYWERGERTIPADVIDTITRLCAWRARAIAQADAAVAAARARHGAPAELALVWYQSQEDWQSMEGRELLMWRPQCSVVADLAARHGATLVTYDTDAYSRWIGRRRDTEATRSAWAAAMCHE